MNANDLAHIAETDLKSYWSLDFCFQNRSPLAK